MSNNCLVTKLKSVVNNDNLPILGGMRVNFFNSEVYNNYSHSFTIRCTEDVTIKAPAGHVFYVDGGTGVNTWTGHSATASTDIVIKGENANYSIVILDKKNLTRIGYISGDSEADHYYGFDVSELFPGTTISIERNMNVHGFVKEVGNIITVTLSNTNAGVDFDNFVAENVAPYFVAMNLLNTPSKGTISSNPSFINFIARNTVASCTLDVRQSNVEGDIIELFDAIRDAGKVSGSITLIVNDLWTLLEIDKRTYIAAYTQEGYTIS